MTEPGNATWLLKRIDDLLGVGKAFIETPSDATREAFFAEMITVASGELLQGLVSEAQGGRLANATRLARHLFEHQVDLLYTLDNFEPRMRQRIADEARNALEQSTATFPEGGAIDTLRDTLNDARTRQAAARETKKAGRKTPVDDLGFVPSLETRAQVVDLEHRYYDYRQMSSMSHPGFRAGLIYAKQADRPAEAETESRFQWLRNDLLELVLCEGVAVFGDILRRAILLREGYSATFQQVNAMTSEAYVRCSSTSDGEPG